MNATCIKCGRGGFEMEDEVYCSACYKVETKCKYRLVKKIQEGNKHEKNK